MSTNGIIELIKACGYRVYVRGELSRVTYCFYTDGKSIAYAQWGNYRPGVSTVHKPNIMSGRGFEFSETINEKSIKGAISCHCPPWAGNKVRASVRKYRDWNEYHNESEFNRELYEV